MIELKPCPFCGSHQTGIQQILWYEYFVYCKNCNAHGSLCDNTQEDAIEAWNTRVSDSLQDNEGGTQ